LPLIQFALKRLFRILRNTLLVFIGLVALLILLLNLTGVQNYLARRAAQMLSDKLHTRVSVNHVRIDFANRLLVQGVYIEDQQRDTLLYAGEIEVKTSDWFFLKKQTPVITYMGLHNAYVHMYRKATSNAWNYQFVIDAFNTGGTDTSKSSNEFELDLKHLDLKKVRFHSDDSWTGNDMDIDVGDLSLDGKSIELKKHQVDLDRIAINSTSVNMRSYRGGKPKSTTSSAVPEIDTTAFNEDGWKFSIDQLTLNDCAYRLTGSSKPAPPKEFDADHLGITKIDLKSSNVKIIGDTIRAHLDQLNANERSGILIKEMHGDVVVSPNESSLSHMLLRTEHSVVGPSYSMRYKRFPDFLEYITKVRMVSDLQDASVDPRDVAVFAPVFTQYFPSQMKASGHFDGTVADFEMKNIHYQDAGTAAIGNLKMKGLPDIDKTLITFTEGTVSTSGTEIFRFAPFLKENTGVNLASLSSIHYTGSFTGYIDDFAADGTLKTNLGTVQSKTKLTMPHFDTRQASYSSEINATDFQLGPLFRQSFLGSISFKGTVSGSGFEPHNAAVKVTADISHLGLYGYNYQGIYADGVLERKKFEGKIQVVDPNLALSFDGTADLSTPEPSIVAHAHLLHASLQPLHLTADSVEASADFDVDANGSNIDNFQGTALLNNINVFRAGHRIDVDSIRMQSSIAANGDKNLYLESNDFTASASGKFQLSKLPYSAQYFLAQYLPSYIPSPKKYAPDQDLIFSVSTKNIDSLLAVLSPTITGFDNSKIAGTLNTTTAQLNLNVDVPYGGIGKVKLNKLLIKGDGDLASIKISGEVADVMVGDSILHLSIDLSTKITQDSIGFNITTSSPGTYGTATLNGSAVAKGDSITLSMLPSEFFLNQSRWEVDGGSHIVYRNHDLVIRDLVFSSGLQRIQAASELDQGKNNLVIQATNLDLAQLSGVAGLNGFAPDGRVDASIHITDILESPSVAATIHANGVKLGTDTVGNITIIGGYNGKSGRLSLETGSGVFRGDASLTANGSVVFDSTSNQQLDGQVALQNAPMSWLNPVLAGYVSRLSGTVNGKVSIRGTGRNPDVEGRLQIQNAALRVDYLGTYYKVPAASIEVNNTEISLGSVPISDVFDNKALLTGKITHDRFRGFRLGLNLTSNEFEVLNLQDYENSLFYGHLIANVKSLSVSGPVDNVHMNIVASPADISHLYIPITSGGDINNYSYVSFKKYGEDQVFSTGPKSKLTININAIINPLAEITMILDPTTGDAINARGNGSLTMDVPANGDFRMYGTFDIDEGDYSFTFRQLFFKRQFSLSSGSRIMFSGPINQTNLDVTAVYSTRASLYDLLSDQEKNSSFIPASELSDTKRQQNVNVILSMQDKMLYPKLKFKLELPEKRSVGTYAYSKFDRLNSNDRDLFNQVASLLLIGYFIPPEGLGGSNVATGALTNIGDILSTTTSAQLTNIVNKLLNDPKLSVDLKYKNYNVSDISAIGPINRNEVKLGIRQNLLNDRLILEVGGSYDWGRPVSTSSTSSNFNLLNDFRIQYLLSKDGRLRFNGFRTTDYDVLVTANGGNVTRSGVGISWRKTFDSFFEFLHSNNYYIRQRHILEEQQKVDSNTIKNTIGTD